MRRFKNKPQSDDDPLKVISRALSQVQRPDGDKALETLRTGKHRTGNGQEYPLSARHHLKAIMKLLRLGHDPSVVPDEARTRFEWQRPDVQDALHKFAVQEGVEPEKLLAAVTPRPMAEQKPSKRRTMPPPAARKTGGSGTYRKTGS